VNSDGIMSGCDQYLISSYYLSMFDLGLLMNGWDDEWNVIYYGGLLNSILFNDIFFSSILFKDILFSLKDILFSVKLLFGGILFNDRLLMSRLFGSLIDAELLFGFEALCSFYYLFYLYSFFFFNLVSSCNPSIQKQYQLM